jgi:hypothetical protein
MLIDEKYGHLTVGSMTVSPCPFLMSLAGCDSLAEEGD